MSEIKPINGWGPGKPANECDSCEADTRGRTLHLVVRLGVPSYYCDRCYAHYGRS